VVHFDAPVHRLEASWVRGVNALLPRDIAIQWAKHVPFEFHCRASAISRRYAYVLMASGVRPSVETGRVGWFHKPLDGAQMQSAANLLIGERDFSSFRAAQCQALSPVKTMISIRVAQKGAYWRIEFEANAFLHHMIRNIMGCLIAVGQGAQTLEWMQNVLDARNRKMAAPTFSPDGLYFLGPVYPPHWGLPDCVPAYDWLP
jgi:tRNA pseudouridine38-40 synthase